MEQPIIDTLAENREIVLQYRRLLRSCKLIIGPDELKQIRSAFDLSLKAYSQMRRKSGEPYIYHPLAVARIAVEEIGLSSTSVVCALLHDAVADNLISQEQVREKFGPLVEKVVDGMNRISGLYTHNLQLQTENYISLFLTITDDVRVMMLKLADRLHNMRSIENFEPEKQLKIATETRFIYAPIAHRLGLYHIKTEMEDLSLKILQPQVYDTLSRKIEKTKGQRKKFIELFIEPVQAELEKQACQFTIKSRMKSVNSIWNKMQKQGVDFEEVYDLFAIRIILKDLPYPREKAECWNIYSIVTNFYTPSPERMRDWISAPKASGYESLHATVMGPENRWVEVQIRTERMDEIAEKGHAAHWKYKEAGKASTHDDWLSQIRELLESPEGQQLDNIAQPVFQEPSHIFIFTPQGDIKKLEAGATVLDFAFAVHTSIGETCTGAKVNDKIVPIRHVLKNGDKVEILTSKNQTPKTDWLNIVTTSRARQKIKRSLREIRYQKAEQGKEILERKFSQMKIDFSEENLFKLLTFFKLKSTLDLYEEIAAEKIDPARIKEVFALKKAEVPSEKLVILPETQLKKGTARKEDILVIDEKIQNIDYHLARCCNPVMGDDIFGFVTVDRGIQVHRSNCPNAADMLTRFPYRMIRARWANAKSKTSFLTEIRLMGVDRLGILNSLSKVISADLKVNMRSISLESNDGIFNGSVQLYVNDLGHLDDLIRKLGRVKGVLKASRADESF